MGPNTALARSKECAVPIYEYTCSNCKAKYELREGFDAPNTHTCERCEKGTAKRVLHAPPVVFKGSGFYATDSKKKSSAHLAADEDNDSDSGKSEAAAGESGDESKPAKSENKTAEKPEKKSGSSAAS